MRSTTSTRQDERKQLRSLPAKAQDNIDPDFNICSKVLLKDMLALNVGVHHILKAGLNLYKSQYMAMIFNKKPCPSMCFSNRGKIRCNISVCFKKTLSKH